MTGKFRRKSHQKSFYDRLKIIAHPKEKKFMEDFSLKKIKNQIIELFEH